MSRALAALRGGRIFITELDEMSSWKPTAHKVMNFFGRRVASGPDGGTAAPAYRRTDPPCPHGTSPARMNYQLVIEAPQEHQAAPTGLGADAQLLKRLEHYVYDAPDHWYIWKELHYLDPVAVGMRLRRAEVFLVRIPLRLKCAPRSRVASGKPEPDRQALRRSGERRLGRGCAERLRDGGGRRNLVRAPGGVSCPGSLGAVIDEPEAGALVGRPAACPLAGESDLLLRRRTRRPARSRRQGVRPLRSVVVRRDAPGDGPVLCCPLRCWIPPGPRPSCAA